jgi:hypothetical protein
MTCDHQINRRQFLLSTAVVGGALVRMRPWSR